MKTIGLNDIDDILARLPSGLDECRRVFSTHQLERFWNSDNHSPFSDEYKQIQLDAYNAIASRTYSPMNEANGDPHSDRERLLPFPYTRGSLTAIADLQFTISRVLHVIKSVPIGHILDFGAGHGHLTLELAKIGFDVTAIDISEFALSSLKDRAEILGLSIKTHLGDFASFPTVDNGYSLIVFKSSLHHYLDHQTLLAQCREALCEDGIVLLSDEPISSLYDIPWGPRIDFESVWAMRSFGWLELGFHEDYFNQMARQAGFLVKRHDFHETKSESIFVLHKSDNTMTRTSTVGKWQGLLRSMKRRIKLG